MGGVWVGRIAFFMSGRAGWGGNGMRDDFDDSDAFYGYTKDTKTHRQRKYKRT